MDKNIKADHSHAPLFEEMLNFNHKSIGNFHVPGHKQGRAFDLQGVKWFQPLLQLDLTEVGTLDDLHDPSGVIADAQSLAADAFEAEHTLFLVGGTTAGNLATILYLCNPGDTIIIQRTCHQSVFHGAMLAGVQAVYLDIEVDLHTGLEKPISTLQLKNLLHKFPSAKGVILTSPSYFGMTQPIKELAQCCHLFNIPLIIDEAHGAHLGFDINLPPSAMQAGADVAIQSTHKMLNSLTMSSMLHVQGQLISVKGLARCLRIIESSSPSYLLMASLDLARRYMMQHGRSKIAEVYSWIKHLHNLIQTLSHLQIVIPPGINDPFKLVLKSSNYSFTGYKIRDWLEERGYYLELADHDKVLFVFSLATTYEEINRLYQVLIELNQVISCEEEKPTPFPLFPKTNSAQISFKELKNISEVPLTKAIGKIATDMIIPYPPGIPIVLPGECFTPEVVEYIQTTVQSGGKVRGLSPSLCVEIVK